MTFSMSHCKRSFGVRRAFGLAWVANLALLTALACGDPEAPPEAVSQRERVVLIHGLARSQTSMSELAEHLAAAGYEVSNLDYDSRDKPPDALVAEVARAVAECCSETAGPVHFVTHSLGGILLRAYLARQAPPNLGRVVLLAPPNHGSEIVDAVGDSPAFAAFFGPTAVELGTGEGSFPNQIASPDYPLGIIAGSQSVNPIGSALLPGPNDGAVTVESAKLEGAADFIVIDATHTFIMSNPVAIAQTEHFLRNGRFERSSE
jgi:triacylglycerol lipase